MKNRILIFICLMFFAPALAGCMQVDGLRGLFVTAEDTAESAQEKAQLAQAQQEIEQRANETEAKRQEMLAGIFPYRQFYYGGSALLVIGIILLVKGVKGAASICIMAGVSAIAIARLVRDYPAVLYGVLVIVALEVVLIWYEEWQRRRSQARLSATAVDLSFTNKILDQTIAGVQEVKAEIPAFKDSINKALMRSQDRDVQEEIVKRKHLGGR